MTAHTEFPGATPRPIECWRVEVYANGDKILNIEHACLSGKERFSEAEEELVRECGRHLLGFVGAPEREDDERFAAEIAQLHRHHLIVRCRNGRSWITAFHHSLDGIDGLFSIPGGGIDGCRDHNNVRAIVQHLQSQVARLESQNKTLREAAEAAKAIPGLLLRRSKSTSVEEMEALWDGVQTILAQLTSALS